jgi:hypothetical protein
MLPARHITCKENVRPNHPEVFSGRPHRLPGVRASPNNLRHVSGASLQQLRRCTPKNLVKNGCLNYRASARKRKISRPDGLKATEKDGQECG